MTPRQQPHAPLQLQRLVTFQYFLFTFLLYILINDMDPAEEDNFPLPVGEWAN